jgi:type I restriction enzyme S subunit
MNKESWSTRIPAGWVARRFDAVARLGEGQVSPLEEAYADLVHVGPENIEANTGRLLRCRTAKELGLRSGKYLFDENAIVYSKIRPNLNKVCVPGFTGLCSADSYPIWSIDGEAERSFLLQFMRSPLFLRQAIATSTRTGMPKINRADLNRLLVPLPPIGLQTRIGQLLQVWDQAIERLRGLMELYERRERALRSILLQGPQRADLSRKSSFSEVRLGDFLRVCLSPIPKPNSAYIALGLRSHGKGTFKRRVEDPAEIMMDTLFAVRREMLVVNITFAWEGAIAVTSPEDEGALVSHRFPTFSFDKTIVLPQFFKHVIRTERFVYELGRVSPGGAGRNRVLNKRDFLNTTVRVPSLEEQARIADLFATNDAQISLTRTRLERTVSQKEGLSIALLTGQLLPGGSG